MGRKKWHQGKFTQTNPAKYSGKGDQTFRSSWERTFMQFCDTNDSVLAWASESIKIPYFNPIKQKQSIYVPDFVIVYLDSNGNKKAELVEIKPLSQTDPGKAKRLNEKMQVAVNYAKWEQAKHWAESRGMTFRILNEGDIYSNRKGGKK